MRAIHLLPAVTLALAGCTHGIEITDLNLRDSYTVTRLTKLQIRPDIEAKSMSWRLFDPQGNETRSSTGPSFLFMEALTGKWTLWLETDGMIREITINVVTEQTPFSPYISKVYEYKPAPGQFVNKMPQYAEGDTEADMVRKCEESLAGDKGELISLGAFGGYVTFGFDHTVPNLDGPDFCLKGNAINVMAPEGTDLEGGGAEPGVILISYDINCNGLPDDPWYEIYGEAHSMPQTIMRYSISYFRPIPLIPGPAGEAYVRYTDSLGDEGHLTSNSTHRQSYWPLWISDAALSFTGTLLPRNDTPLPGGNFFLAALGYGYADQYPNSDISRNSFDISSARDAAGLPVDLPGIDFIRVYTGSMQQCGRLGETSTEIAGATDLHI